MAERKTPPYQGATLRGGAPAPAPAPSPQQIPPHTVVQHLPAREGFSGEPRVIDDDYELVELLGRGAMGSVYQAVDRRLGRVCAIKMLHRDVGDDARLLQRFEREARLLAKLDHENIVGLLDAGVSDAGEHYLVLEFVRGQVLRDVLEATPRLDLPFALDVVTQVSRALLYAHELGIVHRDLKPDNIMLTSHADGRRLVKVLDFGIARTFSGEADLLTQTGAAAGTAAYMAPEQARGERRLDGRADVYALGVVLYECLAGVRPYDGSSYNEILYRVLQQSHEPLHQHRPDLPRALSDAIDAALAKSPERRPPNAWDFVVSLRRAVFDDVTGAATLWAPSGSVAPTGSFVAAAPAVEVAASTDQLAEPIRAARSWRNVVVAASIGAAAGALAVAFTYDRGATEPPPVQEELANAPPNGAPVAVTLDDERAPEAHAGAGPPAATTATQVPESPENDPAGAIRSERAPARSVRSGGPRQPPGTPPAVDSSAPKGPPPAASTGRDSLLLGDYISDSPYEGK